MGAGDKRTYHNRSSDSDYMLRVPRLMMRVLFSPIATTSTFVVYADFDHFVLLWTIGAARARAAPTKARLGSTQQRCEHDQPRGVAGYILGKPLTTHRLVITHTPATASVFFPALWAAKPLPGCMKKRAKERREHSQAPRQQATVLCVYLTRLSLPF